MRTRERLAAQQAELLQALLAGGEAPPGFDPERLRVEVIALRAKRRRVVAYLRPDLHRDLGDRFAELFEAYAVAHPRADGTRARDDAEDFARWLIERGELTRPKKRPRWLQRLWRFCARPRSDRQGAPSE